MSYQVIARKWRPQTFEEVTGQEHITRTLRNAIEHERLHHAYLFSGARGVGKTTTARLLAKAVNCHRADNPTPTPCKTTDPNQCPSCREIAEGRSIDVLEIDAASNTGVDNVRDAIINTVGVRPARDRYKVFIIDEVHMLSGAAFNALLKTLEEPPPRVLFIMATTESHKVPATILSRCQQFEFRTIAAVKIMERLRLIADKESIEVSDDALREIARAGEGSMRDAQSAFDQVISFSEGRIETADVEAALGIAGRELLASVVRAVADREPARALEVVDDLVMRGHDLRNFCRDLMGHLRDLLVTKIAGDASSLADAGDAERKELAAAAKEFSESDLVRFFHSLTETEQNLRESAHPRYQLEVGLVKLVEMRRLAPLAQVIERLGALEEALRTGRAPAATPTSMPPAAAPAGSSGGTAPRRGGSTGGGASASSAAHTNTPTAFAQHDDAAARPSAIDEKNAERTRPSAIDEKSAERTRPSAATTTATTTTTTSSAAAATPAPASQPTTPAPTPRPSTSVETARPSSSAETARPSSSVAASPAASAPNLKLVPTPASAPSDDEVAPFPLEDEPSPPVAKRASSAREEPREPDYFADLPPGLDVAGPPVAFVPSASSSSSFGGASASGDLVDRLKQALEARKKQLLAAALDSAHRVTVTDGELCVEFAPDTKKSLRDELDKADNRRVLREVCAQLTGRETEVRVVSQQSGADAATDEAALEKKRLRELAESRPDVRYVLKTFRADIVDVRRNDAEQP